MNSSFLISLLISYTTENAGYSDSLSNQGKDEGESLFDQAYRQLSSSATVEKTSLRVYGEICFHAKLKGMSAQGTGPYRQILTEITEELCTLNHHYSSTNGSTNGTGYYCNSSATKQTLFIPSSSSRNESTSTTESSTKVEESLRAERTLRMVVPNPSCGCEEGLAMYVFVGRLLGMSIRCMHSMSTMNEKNKPTWSTMYLPFHFPSSFWKQVSLCPQ